MTIPKRPEKLDCVCRSIREEEYQIGYNAAIDNFDKFHEYTMLGIKELSEYLEAPNPNNMNEDLVWEERKSRIEVNKERLDAINKRLRGDT